MTPSERQTAIVNEFNTTDNNILVSSVAGSGKTTLLLLLLEQCEYRALFVAFNKAIQEEIQLKINERGLEQGKAMTMHSLGLNAIRKYKRSFKINKNKNWDIIKQLQSENRILYRGMSREEQLSLNYSLIDMNDISRMYLTDDISEIMQYLASQGKFVYIHPHIDTLWGTLLQIREDGYQQDKIEIDFHDMIYLPVKEQWEIPVYPYYLFVDEAQDMNLAQHGLIDLLITKGTVHKFVAVGDRNQAIYGFAGSSSNSFDLFMDKPGNTVEMPLDYCYRCPIAVVNAANEVYDVMQPIKTEEGIVAEISDISKIQPNSLVLCRNTFPLIQLYFKLLGMGKSSYIYGNEIMLYLIRFLKPYSKDTIYSAFIEMNYKLEELSKDTSEEGKYRHYIFSENYKNFLEISTHMCENTDTVEYLLQRLEELFQNREDAIMLSTIHKAKGLGRDVVYILNEDLIPSKFAITPEQLRQEENLKYVARTRAKKEMYYLNLD